MKEIKNSFEDFAMKYNISLQLDPVSTIACTAITSFFVINVLVIFGLL